MHLFSYNDIIFHNPNEKNTKPAPAHSINYAILTIRFDDLLFCFCYIYILSLYYVILYIGICFLFIFSKTILYRPRPVCMYPARIIPAIQPVPLRVFLFDSFCYILYIDFITSFIYIFIFYSLSAPISCYNLVI